MYNNCTIKYQVHKKRKLRMPEYTIEEQKIVKFILELEKSKLNKWFKENKSGFIIYPPYGYRFQHI